MKTYIIVKTNFEGFHSWKDAPSEVAFLRNLHRHRFDVEVKIEVRHDDRELEFFMVKRRLDAFIKDCIQPKNLSCEQMAKEIVIHAPQMLGRSVSVKVFEDGDNGAEVFSDEKDE